MAKAQKKEPSTLAMAIDTLKTGRLVLPLEINGEALLDAVNDMLGDGADPHFKRRIAFIQALEAQGADLDLTVTLANHFIREIRKEYAESGEVFNFEEVFAEALKD